MSDNSNSIFKKLLERELGRFFNQGISEQKKAELTDRVKQQCEISLYPKGVWRNDLEELHLGMGPDGFEKTAEDDLGGCRRILHVLYNGQRGFCPKIGTQKRGRVYIGYDELTYGKALKALAEMETLDE